MSFLPHQDEDEELLYVEGGWSDAKGESEAIEKSPFPGLQSGQQTPHESQRKKISLKDYKTKDKSAAEVTEKPELPAATEKAPSEIRAINSSVDVKMEDPKDAPKPDRKDERRPSGSHLDGPGSSPIRHSRDELDSERPRKRQRTASPQLDINDEIMSTSIDAATKPAAAKPVHRLPGLSSPTLPASAKSKAIPPLISPSLPKPIKDYLATANSTSSKDMNGDQRRSEPVRSILASAGLGTSSHMRSISQNSAQDALSAPSPHARGLSPGSINGVRTPQRHGTPVLNGVRASPGPRQRHIIVLKYGKKNRKRIDALLRFAPRTKHIDSQHKTATKTVPEVSTKIVKHRENSPVSIKRSHEVTSDPSFRKQRPHAESTSSTEKSSTPLYTSNTNGHKSKPSITKSDFTTPDKSLKSAAMARIASTDAIEARTPPGDRARLSTPTSLDRHLPPSKPSPQPTSGHNNKDQERTTWHALGEKHFALGRKVKSEATSIVQDSDTSREESARSVVLLVEGLLCFMINLAAESQSRASSASSLGDPGWHTILPYHIFVFRASRKFPHLHGIVTQLGAVCRQHLHKFDLEKLMKEPLPAEDHNIGASAPTPGSDGTTKNSSSAEDAERSRKKYIDFRDQLVLNAKELSTAWLDGGRELSLDLIEREYPRTWAGRGKDWSKRGTGAGRHDPGKIPKDYYLPLDATATVFEAVWFAIAFLEEWSGRESVGWGTRIEL